MFFLILFENMLWVLIRSIIEILLMSTQHVFSREKKKRIQTSILFWLKKAPYLQLWIMTCTHTLDQECRLIYIFLSYIY